MSADTSHHGVIRKLWPKEWEKLRDHLLRLDPESRRSRFGHGVSDAFIADYAARSEHAPCLIYGYFTGPDLRAAAELRKRGDTWGKEAEAAFSIEQGWQDQGLGTELMGRVIRAARNRGVHHLYVTCLADNRKMQRIARKHSATLRYEHGDVLGEIIPRQPSALSILGEALDDQHAYLLTVLDLQSARSKAA
jgi:RimJ/RimL family protein N-acetyltransferase